MYFSTYLTKKKDPQRYTHFYPNQSSLIDTWYEGIDKGVVFHDELSKDFMSKYPKVKFIKVKNYEWSANDERFRMFRDYLQEHKEITEVFMTDLFDVKVNTKLKVPKDKLFVSNEGDEWYANSWSMNLFMKAKDSFGLMGKVKYNPGIWGGSREKVIPVLNQMVDMFEDLKTAELNLNMLVFNVVIHGLPQEMILTGYPYHSKFKHFEFRNDVNFIHK